MSDKKTENKTKKSSEKPGQKPDQSSSQESGLTAEEFKQASEEQLKEHGLLQEVTSSMENEVPDGVFPEKDVYELLEENEDGDASLFIELFRGKRIYDHRANPKDAWFYWNDHHWRMDVKQETLHKIREVVRVYKIQRQREGWKIRKIKQDKNLTEEEREQAIKECENWIKKLKEREKQLQTHQRKKNVLQLAACGMNGLSMVGDEWDADPWLLGVRNGVVDLRTGERRDGRPEDMIKTVSPVKYDSAADCPTWRKYIPEIFDGNQEITDFIQRLLGYSIAGLREEHIYPILWGDRGRNGKGTLLETLKLILGSMAYKAPTQTLMRGLQSSASSPDSNLMKLWGARLVWTSEANKRDTIDTAIVKALTGGDTIVARNPYESRQAEWQPTHTLFTVTNPLPRVDAEDDAFWERAILIPFTLSFVTNPIRPWERKADPKLPNKLQEELPGILNWLIEGCLLWQEQGLNVPEKLIASKTEYRENEDIIGHFLADEDYCMVHGPEDQRGRTKPKDLFRAYRVWCKEEGYNPMNKKHFEESAEKRIGKKVKDNIILYKGVTLMQDPPEIF